MRRSDHDFQKFYYSKVGLGEGCGCAERVIDIHEVNRKAATPVTAPMTRKTGLWEKWRRFCNKAGLTRRA